MKKSTKKHFFRKKNTTVKKAQKKLLVFKTLSMRTAFWLVVTHTLQLRGSSNLVP